MLKTNAPFNYEYPSPFRDETGPFDGPGLIQVRKEELDTLKKCNSSLQHDIFYLWVFLTSEELLDNAVEFLEEHASDGIPFYMY